MTDTERLDALERMAWQQPHALAIVPTIGGMVNPGQRMIELQPLDGLCLECMGDGPEPTAHGDLREAIDAACTSTTLQNSAEAQKTAEAEQECCNAFTTL